MKFNITAEQQAILDNKESTSSQKKAVYLAGVGLSTESNNMESIKAYNTLLKEFDAWSINTSHNVSYGEDVVISQCLTCSPSVCSKCGKTTYVSDLYSHDRQLHLVANPSWAEEGYFYFKYDECSKCHLKDDSIYAVSNSNLSNHYQGYSTYGEQYNEDGKKISSYVNVYVYDHHDKNGECEFCHAKVLSVGNVVIHVDINGLAENTYSDSFSRWEYKNYNNEDGYVVRTYEKDGITIKLKSKSEDNKVTYILEVDGVQSEPLVFLYE